MTSETKFIKDSLSKSKKCFSKKCWSTRTKLTCPNLQKLLTFATSSPSRLRRLRTNQMTFIKFSLQILVTHTMPKRPQMVVQSLNSLTTLKSYGAFFIKSLRMWEKHFTFLTWMITDPSTSSSSSVALTNCESKSRRQTLTSAFSI